MYRMGGMGSFELRDYHLLSLRAIATDLRRLTLVGCSRLTGSALAALFDELHNLTYLALDIITVRELQNGFIRSISSKLKVLKFAVTNAPYTHPLVNEEDQLCDEIMSLIERDNPPELIHLQLRERVLGQRWAQWTGLTLLRGVDLRRGDWRLNEFE
jgi:hypothetical protein